MSAIARRVSVVSRGARLHGATPNNASLSLSGRGEAGVVGGSRGGG